jgi:hypothetical protein
MNHGKLKRNGATSSWQMALPKDRSANDAVVNNWRSTVGMFSGDDIMKQIDAAARRIREADRRRARRTKRFVATPCPPHSC